MIRTFKHKGLRRLFEDDDRKLIRPDLVPRVATMLALLDAASAVEDVATPSPRLHPLKGDLKGRWAVTVRANRRIVPRSRAATLRTSISSTITEGGCT